MEGEREREREGKKLERNEMLSKTVVSQQRYGGRKDIILEARFSPRDQERERERNRKTERKKDGMNDFISDDSLELMSRIANHLE